MGLDKSVVPMCHLIVSINLKYRANVFIEKTPFCHAGTECLSVLLHIILFLLTHSQVCIITIFSVTYA